MNLNRNKTRQVILVTKLFFIIIIILSILNANAQTVSGGRSLKKYFKKVDKKICFNNDTAKHQTLFEFDLSIYDNSKRVIYQPINDTLFWGFANLNFYNDKINVNEDADFDFFSYDFKNEKLYYFRNFDINYHIISDSLAMKIWYGSDFIHVFDSDQNYILCIDYVTWDNIENSFFIYEVYQNKKRANRKTQVFRKKRFKILNKVIEDRDVFPEFIKLFETLNCSGGLDFEINGFRKNDYNRLKKLNLNRPL